MKTIATSKGEFVAMNMKHNSWFQNTPLPEGYTTKGFIKLSEATEEDAKDVVDEKEMFSYGSEKKFVKVYEDYIDKILVHRNPLHSLHSLLKSKAIDINNGNLYLFKKI